VSIFPAYERCGRYGAVQVGSSEGRRPLPAHVARPHDDLGLDHDHALALVGRDEVTARIASLIGATTAGSGGVLALVGPAGLGKTALLEWAAGRAPSSAEVLRADGAESEAAIPYAGLSQLLRRALGLIDGLAVPQADAVRGALRLGGPSLVDPLALGSAVLSLLGVIATGGPVVVLVDDAQWIDRVSLAALRFACRRLGGEGVAVLVASRTDEPVRDLPVLRLAGLDPEAAAALYSRLARRPVGGDEVAALQRLTGGNPLAIGEVARAGREALASPYVAPPAIGEVFEDEYRRHVAFFPPTTTWALLVVAAHFGRPAGCEALGRALGGRADLTGTFLPAERRGIVSLDADGVRFRCPLMRAACYRTATLEDRRRAHALLAACSDQPDALVWHRAAASTGPDGDVAAALADAGRAAAERGAHGEAANCYARAATLAEHRGEATRHRVAAAAELHRAGRSDAAARLIDDIGWRATDADVVATTARIRAEASLWGSDPRAVRQLLATAAGRVEPTDSVGAAGLLLGTILPCVLVGDARAAVAPARRARELLGADHPLVGLALGIAATEDGERQRGRGELVRAATMLREADPLQFGPAAVLVAMALGVHRELDHADAVIDGVVAASTVENSPTVLPFARAVQSLLSFWRGDWDRAAAHGAAGLAVAQAAGETPGPCFVLPMYVEASRGAEARCRELADGYFALKGRDEYRGLEPWCHAALGRLELTTGRAAVAIAEYEWALETNPPGSAPDWRADAIEAYAAAGRRREAECRADELVAAAAIDLTTDPLTRGCAALVQLVRVTSGEAAAVYESGRTELRSISDRFGCARLELAYGARLRRERRVSDARHHLATAVGCFERLRAGPWTERAARELRAAGGSLDRALPGTLDGLTPQERSVALVVAAGATNREAAQRLVLSHKTVAFHLGRIYRKLGIRSRTELAHVIGSGYPR